jgi:hypothetical protein
VAQARRHGHVAFRGNSGVTGWGRSERTGHGERPPTGHRGVHSTILHRLGLTPVTFSVNGDGGATYPPDTVFREVTASKSGDIVIAHANLPGSGTAAGMARALPALQSSGRAPIHFRG